jgi:hypothetical protein
MMNLILSLITYLLATLPVVRADNSTFLDAIASLPSCAVRFPFLKFIPRVLTGFGI